MKFLSSREHPGVLLCCAAPIFLLFHYSLFLKFVKNFEITCQDNDFTLKVEFAFKIQYFWWVQMIILSIPDFWVTTAILNPVDVYRRSCKLSFRPMQNQVKSRHFSE